MEGAPKHQGTLNVAENKLAHLTKEREKIEAALPNYAARIEAYKKANPEDPYKDLQAAADAAEYADMEANVERLKAEETELRGLLDKAKEIDELGDTQLAA